MKGIDKKDLDMILQWFSKSDLASATLEYSEKGAFKIELSRTSHSPPPSASYVMGTTTAQNPAVHADMSAQASAPAAESEQNKEKEYKEIKAPIVGTFYRSSNPDAPPFVQVGDIIKKGQTLCIIEAMKVMNEFEAEFDMEILDILVENTTLVEYGQVLFKVIPL